jgi:hypothetical protein
MRVLLRLFGRFRTLHPVAAEPLVVGEEMRPSEYGRPVFVREGAAVMATVMSPSALISLERAVEASTGERVEVIRSRSLEETRRLAEKRQGRPLKFVSHFPFIGRGNVLRDRLVSHEQVEADLDAVLGSR